MSRTVNIVVKYITFKIITLPDVCIVKKYYANIFVAIPLSFEHSSYTVDEGDVSILPVLKLSEPSPCCITIYAELTDGPGSDQATGKFHYYVVFLFNFCKCL